MSLTEDSGTYQVRVLRGLFSAANTNEEKTYRVRDFTRSLSDEHFTDKYRVVCQVVQKYFHLTYALVSPHDFMDAVRNADDMDEAKEFAYRQVLLSLMFGDFDPQKGRPNGDLAYLTNAEFTYAIERLKEYTQTEKYGNLLADTMQVLTGGKSHNTEFLRGFEDARDLYAGSLVDIEKLGGADLPSGTVQDEAEEIKREYTAAKHGTGTTNFRVLSGIHEIDRLTGGAKPGEMWFIAGFTGEGKTTECINMTYNAMMHGQNSVFATAETLRHQVRRRLIARHSIHPKFARPKGISTNAIKMGQLSDDDETLLFDVIDDLTMCEDYGKFKIVQIPRRCTVDYLQAVLARYETEFFIHIAVWDELRLGGVPYHRGSRREELNDIITDAKQLAVNHKHMDTSTGIVLLAPYQVNRDSWQTAVADGRYTKSCMAETSEAEKTADLIWSHLIKPDTKELKCQVLKYRDGSDHVDDFTLDWRPEVCFMGSVGTDVIDDYLDEDL